jgi:glycosyltransferase involved in cell wall biosynthesis
MKNIIDNIGEEKQLVGFELEVFNILKKKLKGFKDYLFVIYGNNGNDLPLSRHIQHDKKVLIWRSNENKLNRVDELKKNYKHIFTNYYFDNTNSTSLQLGYHTETKNKTIIPIKERLFGISFTGCLNRNRIQIASTLTNIPIKWLSLGMVFNKKLTLKIVNGIIKWKYPKDYYQFNDGFNNGLNEEDYNFILKNTKIALCPKGWVNQETFRLYESMKWGCVVISEDLPNRSYYKGIPIIKVKDWSEGIEIAKELINDTNELEKLSKQNIQYYKDSLSPEASADLIIKKLTGGRG